MATARMTLFKPIFIDQRVALTPSEFREASADVDAYLLAKIRKGLEDQCCTHGYVRPGSTQILARSMGQAEHGHFTGDFLYTCKVKIMCLLPVADQILEARVLKTNKLGAYALIVDEGRLREAMRILMPRDLHLGNTAFDSLKEGQGVRVRFMKSRFQAKASFISAIGVFEGLEPSADAKPEQEEEEPTLQPAVEDTEPVVRQKKRLAETQAAQNITQTAAYDAPPIITKKKAVQNAALPAVNVGVADVAEAKPEEAETHAAQNITQTAAYDAPPIITKKRTMRNAAALPTVNVGVAEAKPEAANAPFLLQSVSNAFQEGKEESKEE